jgi:hypothetical protein
MPVILKIDDRNMRKFIRTMPQASARSQARALNKAITQTRTKAAREVAEKRNILVGRAKREMRIQRATFTRPEAAIIARGDPIPVMDVKGAKRQTKRGVVAKIEGKGKGKPHLFEGAFIAVMPSGHKGVFKRRGNKRLPIIEEKLPSIASTMIQDEVDIKLRAFAAPIYEAELVRLLNFEMTKSGAK